MIKKILLPNTERIIQRDIANGFSGISLVVNYKNEIIHNSSSGYALRYGRDGGYLAEPKLLTDNMLFDLASLAKIFVTTYALMYLYERNKISLDRLITHYIPEFSFSNSEYIPTIRHLLSHITGLAPEIHFYDSNDNNQFYSQDRESTVEMLLTKLPLVTEPLKYSVYSDNSMMILGCLIERLTDQRLDVFVDEVIYKPLGLERTCFNPLSHNFKPDDIVATQIDGHLNNGTRCFNNIRTELLRGEVHDEKALYSMGGVAGHAGIFGTSSETAILASLLWTDNEFFSPETVALFRQSSSVNESFGLGFRLAKGREMRQFWGESCSNNSFGHLGFTGISLMVDPNVDLAVLICGNSVHCPMIYPRQFLGKTYSCGKYNNVIDSVYLDLGLV